MALIGDYALLGDLQTAALVSREGSIDWLCLPSFDSGACFAALLGDQSNGHWRLAPDDATSTPRRRYVDDTLVLETVWQTPTGTVQVIDFMPPRGHAPDVVRVVRGLSGWVEMRSELRLRFDYGHVVPWVHHTDRQVAAVAGPDAAWLRASVPVYGDDLASMATFVISPARRNRSC